MTPLLLLTCLLLSPQQRRVPGAWTVPCSAGSSARQGRAPAAPACPPSRRTTVDDASRSSSHPAVGAPTLQWPLWQPLSCPACKPAPLLCSSRRFPWLGAAPAPAAPLLPVLWLLLPMSAVSPWGQQLRPSHPKPQLNAVVGWFWGWQAAHRPDPAPCASSCHCAGDHVCCWALPAPRGSQGQDGAQVAARVLRGLPRCPGVGSFWSRECGHAEPQALHKQGRGFWCTEL